MTATSKYRAVVGGLLASGILMIGTSTAVAASTGDLAPIVLESPSDVVWDTIDSVFGEVASIGSAVLFAYGFLHLVKLGTDTGDTSGSFRKLGLSWGLGIAVQSWQVFRDFVQDEGSSTAAPLISDYSADLLVAIGYLPL